MATMDEAEALRYETARLQDRLEKRDQELNQMRNAVNEAQSAAAWVSHFTNLGVPASQLNTRGSLQELSDSGYEALEAQRAQERERMAQMEKELETLRTSGPKEDKTPSAEELGRQAGDLTPPNVATHTPGARIGARSIEQAREAARPYFGGDKPTEEQLYWAVEHGQLPPSVLPGLEGLPPKE